jgi:ubiquinone biosynthesis protein COQ4
MYVHDSVVALDTSDPLFLAEDAGFFARGRAALRAFAVLTKDMAHPIAAPVLNVSMDAEVFARLARQYALTDEGRALLRDQPDLQAASLDLAALQRMPEGTLGKALGHYYKDNGITPFVSSYPVRNDVEYLAKRYREVHDTLHIITGYGTDAISELELQAFVAGNLGLRHPVLILALTAVFMPLGMPPVWRYFDKLRAAYRRGQQSQDVALKPRYEYYWSMTVDEVRRIVGVAPSTH